jgi:hypothetical protein
MNTKQLASINRMARQHKAISTVLVDENMKGEPILYMYCPRVEEESVTDMTTGKKKIVSPALPPLVREYVLNHEGKCVDTSIYSATVKIIAFMQEQGNPIEMEANV